MADDLFPSPEPQARKIGLLVACCVTLLVALLRFPAGPSAAPPVEPEPPPRVWTWTPPPAPPPPATPPVVPPQRVPLPDPPDRPVVPVPESKPDKAPAVPPVRHAFRGKPVPPPRPQPPRPAVFRVGRAGLAPPACVKRVEPRYPAELRRRGAEGTVILRVVIDERGRVADIDVLRSSGHEKLDEEAVRAVREWRYEPARLEGRPVPVEMTVRLNYRLQ